MELTDVASMTAEEMVALSKRHTLYEWTAQSQVHPLPITHGKGAYVWTADGQRLLDFNSQLMCVNIGHGDDRVVRAIGEQAATLAYASPFMATEVRARLGSKLASITPGDVDVFFFTLGGSEANENAIKIARLFTGRNKVLARYRSYHGATAGSITLTGDPRRWAAEPGLPGIIHVPDPYHGMLRGWDPVDEALTTLEEVIAYEGAHTIAAFILEPITGANGLLVPPKGYLEGVREICTRHSILMIADEVMSGFGRTGEWFAVDHWKVVPDLLTMAKGLTSAYVPLGAVGMRRDIADYFAEHVYYGGLTYNSHPLACATALAVLRVYEEDRLIENARRLGVVMKARLDDLTRRHPSVGDTRSIGLFGAVELVRDRAKRIPMAPFNGTSTEMAALNQCFLQEGLYTFFRWNVFFTNPPLSITEQQLHEGFDIIDRGLEITDGVMA